MVYCTGIVTYVINKPRCVTWLESSCPLSIKTAVKGLLLMSTMPSMHLKCHIYKYSYVTEQINSH